MTIVNNTVNLTKAVEKLRKYSIISIDTEFYWKRTYYPQLCLIQIYDGENSYLIDPLADIDISALNDVFEDNNIVKIMHAADNDIKILNHYISTHFNNIFDTQVAAAFLNIDQQISLSNLLRHYNITILNKSSTLSDWRQRPLTSSQITYAQDDVCYLLELYHHLKAELLQYNKYSYFKEDMHILESSSFNIHARSKIKGLNKYNFTKQQQFYAQKLSDWRAECAIKNDKAIQHIISDAVIIDIVKINYLNADQLKTILSSKQYHLYSKEILNITNNRQAILADNKPKMNRISKQIIDDLYAIVIVESKKLNISPSLLCAKKDIKSIILALDNRLAQMNIFEGWRFDIIGQKFINCYNDFYS